ncbi:MAG TPA: aminotransferase class V-fold PLP-dependent enzyme [Pyrinomonadaceae bacterium]|nr:aminotransferase class V-fold PLP-dependent enzyme [Pyrinomonadaceae bacterium]
MDFHVRQPSSGTPDVGLNSKSRPTGTWDFWDEGPGTHCMIYLDNNATTKIAPEVLDAMLPFLEDRFGNPSSAYAVGRSVRAIIDTARQSVADLLRVQPSEIVFTSGGTESDNWSIRGALTAQPSKKHIVTTRVEHEAVRKLCEQLEREGFELTWLDVDENGLLDVDQLRESIRTDTAVVSVMLANNETGVLFPVDEVAKIVKESSEALVHVDGVNAVGKIPIDLRRSGVDLFSLSAHKFHGPKGVGALYIRDGVLLPSMAIGGGQESGRRAGTEAVHQIAGIGAAASLVSNLAPMDTVRSIRDIFEGEILRRVPNASLNGDPVRRLPNTSNISFENTNGEAILARLDAAGICVSTGSACNSADHTVSPVLHAMNVPYSKAMGSIRFSFGRYNRADEVERVVDEVRRVVEELRRMG